MEPGSESMLAIHRRLDDLEDMVSRRLNTRVKAIGKLQSTLWDHHNKLEAVVRTFENRQETQIAQVATDLFGLLHAEQSKFDATQFHWHTTVNRDFKDQLDKLARDVATVSGNATKCCQAVELQTNESLDHVQQQVHRMQQMNTALEARMNGMSRGIQEDMVELDARVRDVTSRQKDIWKQELRRAPGPLARAWTSKEIAERDLSERSRAALANREHRRMLQAWDDEHQLIGDAQDSAEVSRGRLIGPRIEAAQRVASRGRSTDSVGSTRSHEH